MRTSRDRTGIPALFGDGAHDDTAAIQALLDAGSALVRLPSSAAHYLISRPLRVHSGQTLELDRFARVKLAPKSDCLMLENADQGSGNENISVIGGIWDMDNMAQTPNPMAVPTPALRAQKEYRPETYLGIMMRFVNVKNLAVKALTFKDPVTFCLQLARVRGFTVDDIRFDFNRGNPIPGNMDGIHLDGGCVFGRITNLKGTTYDDLVALNADDGSGAPHSPWQFPQERFFTSTSAPRRPCPRHYHGRPQSGPRARQGNGSKHGGKVVRRDQPEANPPRL